jgi:hypothetical protein
MRHALYAASAACWLRSAYASASFRVIPFCSANFSAVSAIGSPQNVSVSPAIKESSSAPPPSRNPLRAPRITNGACVMFSIPPASTISASPSSSRCAACDTASIPDPHKRFTVTAGVSVFSPAFNPTWRAPYSASALVCITLPKIAWSNSAGSAPDRRIASFEACAARSIAETSENEPV